MSYRLSLPPKARIPLVFLALTVLHACTSVPVEEREARRSEIDQQAEKTIQLVKQQYPEFEQAFEESAGYFTAVVSTATVAVVGGGLGTGVLVDKESGERSYLDVKRYDFGAGLGKVEKRAIVLARDAAAIEAIRNGTYFRSLAAEAAAGEKGSSSSYVGGGHTAFTVSGSGASLGATARLTRLSVNRDLTNTGQSELSIPNTGFDIEDGRAPVENPQWDHKLPFLAQDVIDLGYELPLPYGTKLAYVGVVQDQLLEELRVGFSGSEKEPFEFVSFENAVSDSDTVQAIFDLWLFPFMNIYGFYGGLEGTLPVDVLLDGNGMLAHLDVDCARPGNLILCNALQDRQITLPIDATFSGSNYGVGINLAGGWKGFFFTLPITVSWADMDTTEVDGAVLSVSPRAGRVIELGSKGNLAWYLGASYLDSAMTATGSLAIPGTDVTIDYDVDQANKDKWNGVVGANWDINGRWSIQAEYNGFWGSRESFIASASWRF